LLKIANRLPNNLPIFCQKFANLLPFFRDHNSSSWLLR
jgi:hypothetical protein